MVRRHRGDRDDECGRGEAGQRERTDCRAPPPGERGVGADLPPLVERPRRQLAAEKEQHGHERRRRVDPVLEMEDDEGDVRRAPEPEGRAEAPARGT